MTPAATLQTGQNGSSVWLIRASLACVISLETSPKNSWLSSVAVQLHSVEPSLLKSSLLTTAVSEFIHFFILQTEFCFSKLFCRGNIALVYNENINI